MRAIVVLIVLIASFLVVDTAAYHGRYSRAIWLEVNQQAQKLNIEVSNWLKRLSF